MVTLKYLSTHIAINSHCHCRDNINIQVQAYQTNIYGQFAPENHRNTATQVTHYMCKQEKFVMSSEVKAQLAMC
jgi:hypothetical protein